MWWFDPDAIPGWFDWLGIAAFPLTIVAFVIAALEFSRARTATEAVNARLNEARLKLNGDQLAAVLPQFHTVVGDLDFAIDHNDREVAHRALLRFSYVATEAVVLLENLSADHSSMQDRLNVASSWALDLKGEIVSKKAPDIARLGKAMSAEVSAITVEISGIVATARYTLGEAPNVG
jgi:hypothetical protein